MPAAEVNRTLHAEERVTCQSIQSPTIVGGGGGEGGEGRDGGFGVGQGRAANANERTDGGSGGRAGNKRGRAMSKRREEIRTEMAGVQKER